jgi:hypothetical protein
MDPIQQALDAMDAKAADAGNCDSGHGWRHAAIICRLQWGRGRMIEQLQRHAQYFREERPAKAAAYREAAAILRELAGEDTPEPVGPADLTALPPMPLELPLFSPAGEHGLCNP